VNIGTKADLGDFEGGKLIEAEGNSIAVFNIGGQVYAIEKIHRGGPLAEGMIAEDEVICPWHGARFNIKTGAVCSTPAQARVMSVPVPVSIELGHYIYSCVLLFWWCTSRMS